ncbi:beta-galactosidase [Corynespora cassiicola Philippines]|uniref:Beta-galactosidase n=1 Tax=Corynespora cassiicola Philippines TaxID=1448308 RepID=A0A2T2N9L0_CORCC|nr:beta-galactosidase [Corynespora cassiicola Philippines]
MAAYPRPDFERTDIHWQSLNGPWSFIFDDNDDGLAQSWHLKGIPNEVLVNSTSTSSSSSAAESITAKIAAGTQDLIKGNEIKREGATTQKKREIQVPYVWQCPASGIEEKGVHEVFWYEREIKDLRSEEEKKGGKRVLLRFGAVDYEAKVWVSGQYVGGHRGGHVPFEIDITDSFFSGETQRLTLRVYDSAYDLTQPRGKQYWGAQPESIFYTPSGGIWQNVWLEVVPFVRILDSSGGTVLRNDDIIEGKLHATVQISGRPAGHKYSVEMGVSIAGVPISTTEKIEFPKETDAVSFDADMQALEKVPDLRASFCNNVAVWSPELPALYNLVIRLYDSSGALVDEINTTTGMRSISWSGGVFKLNNRPYFQALFLDQGYWPETFMTPPSPEALAKDIELSKAMGFNGCRKHQKVEDPVFLYHADRLGFLVWGEMANAYQFSDQYMERYDQEWREAVKRDINHPSVVAWTPVNESWGYNNLKGDARQRQHVRSLYYATKSLDPSRPVNDNCGWEHVQTDLTTFHDYSDGDVLTKTCSTLEGILSPKADRSMFLSPIEPKHNDPTSDPGSSHSPTSPVICTEFGGINIARASAGSLGGERDWGYTTATDSKDLLKRIEKMLKGITQTGQICGWVYTQLTDIEQEVNGLYTPDRKEKLPAVEMKKLVQESIKAFYEARTKDGVLQ